MLPASTRANSGWLKGWSRHRSGSIASSGVRVTPKRLRFSNPRCRPPALGPFCNQVRRAIQKLGRRGPQKRAKVRQAKRTVPLRNVTIYSAMHGHGPHRVDVKKSPLKELRARGTAFVGNQLGGDPTPNVVKNLQRTLFYRADALQPLLLRPHQQA